MVTSTKQGEQTALAQLHDWKVRGQAGPPLAPDVRHRLEQNRLIRPDEFGQDSITDRGEERLGRLRRQGHGFRSRHR